MAELNLRELLDVLLKNRKQIGLICLAISLLSILVAFSLTPYYSSKASWIPSSSGDEENLSGLAALAGVNLETKSSNNEKFYEDIVGSPNFLKSLYDEDWCIILDGKKIDLVSLYEIKPDSSQVNNLLNINSLIEYGIYEVLSEAISFTSGSVFKLKVETPDRLASYIIASKILEKLVEYNKFIRVGIAEKENQFLKGRLLEFENTLYLSEKKMKIFQEDNKILTSPSLVIKKIRIEREINLSIQMVLEFRKKIELSKLEILKEEEEFNFLETPKIALFQSKPDKKLIVIIGILFGFIFSILLTIMVNQIKLFINTFKDELNHNS